jgi:hypothetical protein
MAWRLALAALALAWHRGADARHSSTTLDPRRATPGLSLELIEAARVRAGDSVKYRLRVKACLRARPSACGPRASAGDFNEVVPELRDGIELDLGPYPRGAAWWVAIATADQKTTAFARVVPYPIAGSRRCVLPVARVDLALRQPLHRRRRRLPAGRRSRSKPAPRVR